jgi:mannose-6-phosphate isomerase
LGDFAGGREDDKQDSDLTCRRKINFSFPMKSYLCFEPIYQERVWGGRALGNFPGRELPGAAPIGESWELVDRPEANSCEADGTTLGSLRLTETEALMGPDWESERPFPILVKWLDCRERLSLQVHPPAEVAPRLKGEPKTENWYIVEATPEAALLAGLEPGVDAGQFREAMESGTLESLVCRLPSRAGDSLFVPSGRLHAIDGGNLILEIQQNSDTTYRVYDWGRVGLDGKPRQLHVEESMQSIDFTDRKPELLHPVGRESLLADCAEFRLRRLELAAGESLSFAAGEEPRILSLVDGSLLAMDGHLACRGDNLLLPYAGTSTWVAEAPTTVLLTDRFTPSAGR